MSNARGPAQQPATVSASNPHTAFQIQTFLRDCVVGGGEIRVFAVFAELGIEVIDARDWP